MSTSVVVLENRDLNRGLLARQHLLVRTPAPVHEVVHHLVGLQAQNPSSPYAALWSRLAAFRPDQLSAALLDRTLTRIVVMRGTIHLLTAQDALVLPALMEPLLRRDLQTNPSHGPALRHVDLDDLALAATDLLENEPMTAAALGPRLAERWVGTDPKALAHAARGMLPLVQVTPRGVWRLSGATTWTTTRAWLGREPVDLSDPEARATALDDVVLRYLGAFGPASVADVQYWSGLGGLRPALERLRPRLVSFRAAGSSAGRAGRELFDLPEAPRPVGTQPAPVRLIPDYDNLTLSHADRSRVISEEHRRLLVSPNGVGPGRILLDGMVAGTWAVTRARSGDGRQASTVATLTVTLFPGSAGARLAAVRRDVDAEARALLAVLADDADDRQVVLTP